MIHCASLACFEDGKVLLVRVRENTLWYFPGGKIDAGESPDAALARELFEELNVIVAPEELQRLTEITAPSHDRNDRVHLHVYTLCNLPACTPGNEVSELGWFDVTDTQFMAPAVIEALRSIKIGL
ncbi:NUDIX hydrolase [Pantoea vagans]|uniref:NUDIX hydrolase n=1 Tax=Pantoea vagans TaxID=470934 RepID=UPI0023B0F835|nr:NUDIX domain-containing protein [Pantoea vagans]MDE8558950.1 NUDIX domain-containing protein [Pantoea vagans]MDE8578955.1 NUDIX domain-containing protein [Pantoea vagans]